MNDIKEIVGQMESQLEAIKTEVTTAEEKGTYAYARNKAVRAAALEIAKLAKNLRVVSIDTFKAGKEKTA